MQAGFLIVASTEGRPVDVALETVPSETILGFPAAAHASWSADDLTARAWVWEHGAPPTGPPWTSTARGLTAVTGDPVTIAGRWRPHHEIAAHLASDPTATADLRGFWAAVSIDATGAGWIDNDPLGMRAIYWAEVPGHLVVATRAALVAQALEALGLTPDRDVGTVAWLAYMSYPIGDGTGYEGVRLLPPGSRIDLRPHAPPAFHRTWACQPDPATQGLAADDLVELAIADLSASLTAMLEVPAARRVIRLTGGKDSRLLLAVARHAGVADELEYETIGPPDLADVVVATELAERFGLAHETRFVGMGSPHPLAERIPRFVEASGGMVNLWDAEPSGDLGDALTLNGACAEILRSPRPLRRQLGTDDIAELFPREAVGPLALLQPSVADELHRRLLLEATHAAAPEMTGRDRLDAFYIANRMRLLRAGPRLELVRDLRASPLYSIGAIQAAYAMGADRRHAEELHFEVIRRTSPELAGHRLVGPGWRPELLERLPAELHPAPSSAGPKPTSVIQGVHRERSEQLDLYRAAVADPTNPVWAVIDQTSVLHHLDRYDELRPRDRREVTGAVTAALWCAGGPLPHPRVP